MTGRLALAALLTAAACGPSSTGGGPPTPPPPRATGDLPARMLRRLSEAAQCSSGRGEQRHWCVASDGWEGGTAADLPEGRTVLAGLSLGMLEEGEVEDALLDNVFFAAFGVKNEGGKTTGLITDVNPSGLDERKMVDDAIARTTEALKGKATTITIAAPLYDYLASVPPAANYALIRGDRSWILEGAARAEIRKIGDVWVALEQPTKGPPGLFVTLFWGQAPTAEPTETKGSLDGPARSLAAQPSGTPVPAYRLARPAEERRVIGEYLVRHHFPPL